MDIQHCGVRIARLGGVYLSKVGVQVDHVVFLLGILDISVRDTR